MFSRRAFAKYFLLWATLPCPAFAQSSIKSKRIAMLMANTETDPDGKARVDAFLSVVTSLGWGGPKHIQVDLRWAASDPQLLAAHARDLVNREPDVLLADGTPSVAALMRETSNIPIVFVRVGDPIGSGFVESLARPGKNATGFTAFDPLMGPKWLQLVKEAVPRIGLVALLFNPATAPHIDALFLNKIESAANEMGIRVVAARVRNRTDIQLAMQNLQHEPNSGFIAMPDTFLIDHRALLIQLASEFQLPAIYSNRVFVSEGGLMAYGFPVLDAYRQAGVYADRILRGARIDDLPVQGPSNWEFVVNLKSARSLGLTISQALLARADEIVE